MATHLEATAPAVARLVEPAAPANDLSGVFGKADQHAGTCPQVEVVGQRCCVPRILELAQPLGVGKNLSRVAAISKRTATCAAVWGQRFTGTSAAASSSTALPECAAWIAVTSFWSPSLAGSGACAPTKPSARCPPSAQGHSRTPGAPR